MSFCSHIFRNHAYSWSNILWFLSYDDENGFGIILLPRLLLGGWRLLEYGGAQVSVPFADTVWFSNVFTTLCKQIWNRRLWIHFIIYIRLPSWQRNWTVPIMLIVLFLVSHFNCLFVRCGRLSWLHVSFLLHVKYTLSYRILSYRIVFHPSIHQVFFRLIITAFTERKKTHES